MLEKLLELLLSAKSGVIAGVFLIGTTGALVTATVQNGVTTITITEASPSPSSSASASPSPSTSLVTAATPSPSSSVSPLVAAPQGTSDACEAQEKAAEHAVKTVDRAFSQFHSDLSHRRENLRSDTARATIEKADKLLKQIRQDAVQAIHATVACKDDDEDEDKDEQDEDRDEHKDGDKGHAQGNFLIVLIGNLLGTNNNTNTTNTATPTPTPTTAASPVVTTTPTGTDPQSIADQAVAAMKVVFDDAVAQLPAQTSKVRSSKSPEPRHDSEHEDDD